MSLPEGFIFDIYRGTTHDGPGLRSTVFFKGCPLHCAWCHNPEGISPQQQIWWEKNKCIGCLQCCENCKTGACQATEQGITLGQSKCVMCGMCINGCPSGALSYVGKTWRLDELVKELLKDKVYFKKFNGGVTASGGEPLLQHEFVAQLFQKLKGREIHTTLDTCGAVPFSCFEEVLPDTDCILYDIKILDPKQHFVYTGQDNATILDNLALIADNLRSKMYEAELWIRTPLIPGATSDKANINAIAEYIEKNLSDVVSRWELCAFNKACTNKYQKLQRSWDDENLPMIKSLEAEALKAIALKHGFDEQKFAVTGILTEV